MKPAPIVNGEELPDGYGVLFEQTESPLWGMLNQNSMFARGVMTLRAWVTKRDPVTKNFEKDREVTGQSIRLWDDQGRAWEYDGEELIVFEDVIEFRLEDEEEDEAYDE